MMGFLPFSENWFEEGDIYFPGNHCQFLPIVLCFFPASFLSFTFVKSSVVGGVHFGRAE